MSTGSTSSHPPHVMLNSSTHLMTTNQINEFLYNLLISKFGHLVFFFILLLILDVFFLLEMD